MSVKVRGKLKSVVLMLIAVLALAVPASAVATVEPPVKEIPERLIGGGVNKGTKGSVCILASEECRYGEPSEKPGAFEVAEGVAVGPAPQHYVYVTDKINRRIQVFTPAGAFVSMFGWEVNKTKAEKGAPQAERNICTAASGDTCRAGQSAPGGPAGAIDQPSSIAVDQSDGAVYVLEYSQNRIEKYTANGEFVLMVGGEVNKKDKTSTLCVKVEQAECQTGVATPAGMTTHGWFKPRASQGNLLAVGPGGGLHVGDEGRVQEFDKAGVYQREVSVPGTVGALAVNAGGEMFLTNEPLAKTIHKFAADGKEIVTGGWPVTLKPKEADVEIFAANTVAVDLGGRLAVSFLERYRDFHGITHTVTYGSLLSGATGDLITSFVLEVIEDIGFSPQSGGIAFSTEEVNGGGGGYRMYAVTQRKAMFVYQPVPVAELLLKGAACLEGAEKDTNVRLDCELLGEVNPHEVPNTEIWFEWGRTPALGELTPKQLVCTICGNSAVPVSATIQGVRPNESGFYFQLAGVDANVKPSEVLESHNPRQESFTTPIVPSLIIGEPEVSFVHATSASMFSELNPENAKTEYFFEYAAGEETLAKCPNGIRQESCPGIATTAVGEAPCQKIKGLEECVYGAIGTTLEATGLLPSTSYRFRLFAEDKNVAGDETLSSIGKEGAFTTAPTPLPQAETGVFSAVGATTATIFGTVNSDGQSATYAFELGVYNGDATQYGIVFSGPVAASTSSSLESLQLTGLQPGTAYAYRITIKNGYGEATGAAVMFKTQTQRELSGPSEVQMLGVPFKFPAERKPPTKCRRGYVHNGPGKCVKAKARKKARRAAKHRTRTHGRGAHGKGR